MMVLMLLVVQDHGAGPRQSGGAGPAGCLVVEGGRRVQGAVGQALPQPRSAGLDSVLLLVACPSVVGYSNSFAYYFVVFILRSRRKY